MNSDTIRFWKCCNRPKSSLLHSCIFPVAKYVNVVNVVIMSISGTMAFLRSVRDVNMSLIRSVTNMIPARSNVQRLINSLSCIVCSTFLLPLHVSSIFSAAKETLQPLQSPRPYSYQFRTLRPLLRVKMLSELHFFFTRIFSFNLRGEFS